MENLDSDFNVRKIDREKNTFMCICALVSFVKVCKITIQLFVDISKM